VAADLPPVSPPTKSPLRVVRPSECCYAPSLQGPLVPCSRRALASFPTELAVFLSTPSPVSLPIRVHPPVSLSFPSETPACHPLRRARGAASLGVAFPLRDINQPRRYGGIPTPPPRRSAVSHDLSDFRCRPLRVYFTPLPRPGFSLQGFVPPPQPEPTRRRPVPSRRLRAAVCDGCPPRQLRQSRPQGFAPWRSPWRRRRCYPTPSLVPLLGFSSSRFSVSSPSGCLHTPSARGLSRHLPKYLPRGSSACSRLGSPTDLFRDPPTCPRFLACRIAATRRPLLPAVHFDRRPFVVRGTLQRLYQDVTWA
jgi:hypothetical protein